MSTADIIGRINRLQRSMLFKIIASCVVVALTIAALIYYGVEQSRTFDQSKDGVQVMVTPGATPTSGLDAEGVRRREAAREAIEADTQYLNDLLAKQADWGGVAVVGCLVAGIVLCFIWIGLGAVAPVLLGLVALIAWRLKLFGGQNVGFEELSRFDVFLLFVAGMAVLAASFLTMMELLKVLFSYSHPIFAVARNVVAEAVRLRVSLVLIVLLMFGLAALPGLLDPGTPLRYRVQSFLEYGTGGAFWVIAVLVLFLSVGSVTFEQRDRIIWQTMTKPVTAWEYLLGKWLGVVGVAAALLLVSASGVFAFTEYLARQKATGEVSPYVSASSDYVSEDREILQTQVLTARRTVLPTAPEIVHDEVDSEIIRRLERELAQSGQPVTQENLERMSTPDRTEPIRKEIEREIKDQFRTIEDGAVNTYYFDNLQGARRTTWMSVDAAAARLNLSRDDVTTMAQQAKLVSRTTGGRMEIGFLSVEPVMLRYKIQSGSNDPRTVFKVSFWILGQQFPIVRECPLNTAMTLPIAPSAIDENGRLELKVVNGDVVSRIPNGAAMTLASDGFNIFYSVGSYRLNFFRVVFVLWLKLAFLGMVAIAASTFLSFPVAAMISFGILLIAEGASFVWEALNYYDAEVDGKLDLMRLLVRAISLPISWTFRHYSEISPIESLANGQLVSWGLVMQSIMVLGGACVILYVLGVVIFRRRELATYSGQ